MKLICSLVLLLQLSAVAHAADLLKELSYEHDKTCSEVVKEFVSVSLPAAKKAKIIVPLSHVSVTQGSYDQSFITLVAIDDNYYALVLNGEYNCDHLTLVRSQKIKVE